MTFSKISKSQTLPKKHRKAKNSKNSKSHVRRPQIKKCQKINYNQNLNILRIPFSKITKTKKLSQKRTPKNDQNPKIISEALKRNFKYSKD